MPKPALLFDDKHDDEVGERLAINSKYAERFENRKRKQDLARARELGLDSAVVETDSEEDVSEDDGAALTADLDARVRQTIELIRKKDPRVYDPSVTFFDNDDGEGAPARSLEEAPADPTSKPKKDKKKKKLAASDVLRQQLVDAATRGAEDAFDEDEEDAPIQKRGSQIDRPAKAYNAEQESLRRAFLDTVNKDSALAEAASEEALLTEAAPRLASRARVLEDPQEPPLSREELKRHLRSKNGDGLATHAGELADGEAFLSAYMQAQAWRDDGPSGLQQSSRPEAASVVSSLESDEEALAAADAFEAQYNFRFEDPAGARIVTHSRHPEDSLRRKDTSRQDERARRKERKDAEKAQAAAEVRRLMNLKRAEAKARMKQVRAIAGNGVDMERLAAVLGDELDADFDPATYDAKMAQIFGDDYFGAPELEADVEGGGSKKRASWVYGDGPRPEWAGPSAEELAAGADDGLTQGGVWKGADEDCEEEDEGGNDPAVTGRRRDRGRRQRKRAGASEVARASAEIAAEDEAAAGADPDEVLALGFEDVIAGGLRTRFAYTAVPADDFGLTTEDLLLADDADLSRYVSLRKLAPYREQPWVVPSKRRRREVAEIRKRLRQRDGTSTGEKSTLSEGAEAADEASESATAATVTAGGSDTVEDTPGGAGDAARLASDPADSERQQQRRDKKRRRKEKDAARVASGVTASGVKTSRLASYNF